MTEPTAKKDNLKLQQSKNAMKMRSVFETHSPWYLIGKHNGGNLQPTCYGTSEGIGVFFVCFLSAPIRKQQVLI